MNIYRLDSFFIAHKEGDKWYCYSGGISYSWVRLYTRKQFPSATWCPEEVVADGFYRPSSPLEFMLITGEVARPEDMND